MMMMSRLMLLALLAVLAFCGSSTAFVVPNTGVFGVRTQSCTALEACRVNAKKLKQLRNREYARKFAVKRGTSRKKMMKKLLAAEQRKIEAEFIAKCFITTEGPGEEEGSTEEAPAK